MIGPDSIRELRADENDKVAGLLCAAFPTGTEAKLVRQLRVDGDMVAEMVLPWEDKIGAYAALSRMQAPQGWLCLAPVATRPEFQGGALAPTPNTRNKFRFGTRLITAIAQMAKNDAFKKLGPVVVLGKPSFYARCGFSSERAAKLTSPYPVSHTLLAAPGTDVPEEVLIYPKGFNILS